MALTTHNSGLARDLINKKLQYETERDLFFVNNKMSGKGENNIVIEDDQPNFGEGQSISFGLSYRMTGDGVTGDNEVEGQGEPLSMYKQLVAIDQIRAGVELKGRLDEAQSAYNLRDSARFSAKVWQKEMIEKNILMKLAGITETDLTDVSGTVYSGRALWSNTPAVVPAADQSAGEGTRYICADTDGLDSLAVTDVTTIGLLYKGKAKAKGTRPKISGVMQNGKELYAWLLHPYQIYDLKTQSTGNNWNQISREAGPRTDKNDIRTGALGVIDNVAIYEHDLIPRCQANADFDAAGPATPVNAFRSLFLGAGALVWTKARVAGVNTSIFMEEDTKDVRNKAIFVTGFIGGIQKLTFNGIDHGVIAIDTASSLGN